MLEESLALQYTQISDLVADLRRLGDQPELINYGSLMKHLQGECVFHLSALASAAILRIRDLEDKISKLEEEIKDRKHIEVTNWQSEWENRPK